MYLIVLMNKLLMYMYILNHGIIFKLTSNYGKLNCIVVYSFIEIIWVFIIILYLNSEMKHYNNTIIH